MATLESGRLPADVAEVEVVLSAPNNPLRTAWKPSGAPAANTILFWRNARRLKFVSFIIGSRWIVAIYLTLDSTCQESSQKRVPEARHRMRFTSKLSGQLMKRLNCHVCSSQQLPIALGAEDARLIDRRELLWRFGGGLGGIA